MLKNFSILALVALLINGCKLTDALDAKPDEFNFEIDAQRDTLIAIDNNRFASQASFEIQGEISHQAKLFWDSAPLDTLSYSSQLAPATRKIIIDSGKVDITDTQEYYSRRLYMKYIPSSDSTIGRLRVKVKI